MLKDIAAITGIKQTGTKAELVDRILEFMQEPSTDLMIHKSAGSPAKRSRSKKGSKGKKGKKNSTGEKRPMSSYMLWANEHRAEVKKEYNISSVKEIGSKLGEVSTHGCAACCIGAH